MAIEIKQNLVSPSKHSIKCPYEMTPEYITIHNTYNDASAANEIKYMITNSNEVSFHIAVDDVQALQGIPLNRNAWACGDGGSGTGNRKSISIEICYSKSGGERYKKAEANTIKLVAQMLKERGWGIDRVKKHQDWSGKYCPHRILDEKRWDSFKKEIQNELNSLNEPVRTNPLPSGIIGQVRVIVDGLYGVVTANAANDEIVTVKLKKGQVYNVTANVDDYHCLIVDEKIKCLVRGDNGKNLELVR